MTETAREAGPRWRSICAFVLLVLAALALAAAVVFIHLERNVFDSAYFADHAQSALEAPEVRTVAATELTDQLIEEIEPDAIAIRPLIETIAESLIQSDAFGRTFRSAALQLHQATIDGDVDGAVLTVANVGVLASGALEKVNPRLAKQIPTGFDAALLRVGRLDSITAFADAARLSRTLAWILPLAAALLLLAAFGISNRRRRLTRVTGFALIGSGLLIAVGFFVARSVVLASINGVDDAQLKAIATVWDEYMRGLLVDAAVVGAIGAVVAAVADGVLDGVGLGERLRAAWVVISKPPAATGWRLLWILGALLLGFWIATNPDGAARLAALLIGVMIAARGLQELAMMFAPAETDQQRAAVVKQDRKIYLLGAASIVGVLLLGLVIATRGGGGLETLGIVTNQRACNGSESLCEKRLNEVALPTTHNSMADQTYPGWLFPSQEAPIGRQLADGIRGLQIDVYYGFPGSRVYTDADRSSPGARQVMKDEFGTEFVGAADRVRRSLSRPQGVAPQLYLCHGFCELGAIRLSAALGQVNKYLEANPRDVLTIVFEDYVPWKSLASALEESGVAKHAYRGPWSGQLPTLEEMINKDQRVVLLTENEKPTIPWMHSAYDIYQETPFHFRSAAALASKRSCDPLRGEPENPLFLINHWVDTAPNPRPTIARKVNSFDFLYERVRRCEVDRQLFPNMVAVDFYREGDLFKVADKLNGVR